MRKANQLVRYSYICPKCFDVCDLSFNINVTLLDVSNTNTDLFFSGLNNRVLCKDCNELMNECDSEIACLISSINQMGFRTGYCCQGHFISPTKDFYKKIKDKTLKNFEISNRSALYIPYVNITLNEMEFPSTALDVPDLITSVLKRMNGCNLSYNLIKYYSDNDHETIIDGYLKEDDELRIEKLNILKSHLYKAAEAMNQNPDEIYEFVVSNQSYSNGDRYIDHLRLENNYPDNDIYTFLTKIKTELVKRCKVKVDIKSIISKMHKIFGMQNSKSRITILDDVKTETWQFDDMSLTFIPEYYLFSIRILNNSDEVKKFVRYLATIPYCDLRTQYTNTKFSDISLYEKRFELISDTNWSTY